MSKKELKKTDKTLEMNVDDLMRTVPVICSVCGKIYHLKHWKATEGKETAVSHGMCPECEKKQKESPRRGSNMQTMICNPDDLPKTIPIACAWCGKIYQLKQWEIKGRTGVSHGICPQCAEKNKRELDQFKDES